MVKGGVVSSSSARQGAQFASLCSACPKSGAEEAPRDPEEVRASGFLQECMPVCPR